MKRNLKRLALALVMSTSCFLATVFWFESGNDGGSKGAQSAVARLNDLKNGDVQRKAVAQIMWENVGKNEDLYPGEAIRTKAGAEAKIELIKSKTVITLEPDSLVVLEESDRGLSLDFLQGNLFVAGGSGDTSNITLKTGSGELKLNSADLSLSRGQDGKTNLEVFKGQAQYAQDGRTVAVDKAAQISEGGLSVAKDIMKIVSPYPNSIVYLNLAGNEKVSVNFSPLPKGYKVSAEWGDQRSNLRSTDASDVDGTSGKLSFTRKAGTGYLRLVAKAENPALPPLASSSIKVTIEPKIPPMLEAPNGESAVLKKAEDAKVAFSWTNRMSFESQVLEVAKDPQFKNHAIKQNFDGKVPSFEGDLPDGTYYWRVTGFFKFGEKSEALTSKPVKFTAQSRWEIKPPVLVQPSNQQYVPYADAQKSGVNFKWQTATGVKAYRILAQKKSGDSWTTVLEKDVEAATTRIINVTPGVYKWKVSSLDPKGGPSKESALYTFTVEEMPKIEWVNAPPEFEYTTPTPSLQASWKPLVQAPASYRYRIKEGELDGEWRTTKLTMFDVPLKAEGEYEAVIEAINAKGNTIAQSDLRKFRVKRRPLLPAPQWAQNTPEVIKSDAKGNLSFGWQEVEGAKHYLMILENENGKVIEQKEITRTTASFNRLKPGQYKVKLKSVDTMKRPSSESREKPILVPSISDIQAPKIKNMKVK